MEMVSKADAGLGISDDSGTLCHGPGDPPAIGDGNGVMSAKGPVAGEESREAGEREPTVLGAAERVDLTLVLRRGMLAVEDV